MNGRSRLVASALLALVFLTGSLVGMAVEEGFGIDWFDFLDKDEDAMDMRFLSDLRLDTEQEDNIERILERREDDLENYWRSRVPELRAILAASDDSIRAVLSPGQRERFDQIISNGGERIPDGPD